MSSIAIWSANGGSATAAAEADVVSVNATRRSTCAVFDGGAVKCWGWNIYGSLGLGDMEDRGDEPGEMGDWLPTVDLGSGVRATEVGGGFGYACALLVDESLKCWGLLLGSSSDPIGDEAGEMGDDLPRVDLGTGQSVAAVAMGSRHVCAVVDGGSVKCFGLNLNGQLGAGDTDYRGDDAGEMGGSLPWVNLGTGRTALAVTAGFGHTCALLDNGSVKCWGLNTYGQLGIGDTQRRGDEPGEMGDNLPSVDLGPGRTAVSITAGFESTCAILDNGSLKCWGRNANGRLGVGDTENRGDEPGEMGNNLPTVDLGTGRTATQIAVGANHVCASLDDGSLKCWGLGFAGRLGSGDTEDRGDEPGEMGDNLPVVDLGGGRSAIDVAAGDGHTCALLDDRSVKCWGWNGQGQGQLGLGDDENRGDDPGEMGDSLEEVDLGSVPLPPADEPCDGIDPVICYAPHVLFHPDEDFFPMDVNDFVNGSVLKWQGCRASEMVVNANPSPESLRLHAAHSWDQADGYWDIVTVGLGGRLYCRPDSDSRLFAANEFTRFEKDGSNNQADRATVNGLPDGVPLDLSQGFFLDWEDGRASGADPQQHPVPQIGRFIDAPVYFERSDDQISYWFFYGYDPKADWSWDDIDVIWDRYGLPHLGIDDVNPIGIIDGVTAHEGDWEHITIDLNANGQPTEVSYAGHGCDEKEVPWADVDKTDGTHPHVYVAEGSHASYPDEIDLGETYCTEYPTGQADVTEFDPATSVEWRSWEGVGTKPLEAECWYGFGGAWGDHRHIGTLLEPLATHAAGPVGPPYNSSIAEGQTPLSTSECRPEWGWAGSPVTEAVLGAVYEWDDPVALGFEDGEPLTDTVFWLNSLPTEVARGTVDADGSLEIAFEIPYGTPPGPHRLVGQAVESGATFYAATFWVDAPVECRVDEYPSTGDVDGDLVIDTCDPSLDDGPDADYDGDGVANEIDNCPTVPNPNQDTAFDGRVVGTACDERLGINTTQFIVETDNNPPTIDATVNPPLNAAGWANTAVTVTADCNDTEGPIASCSEPVVVDTEGADQAVNLRAVDAVANETSVESVVSIDTTAPSIEIVGVQDGDVVPFDTYETPACVAGDALSGLNGQCTIVIDEIATSPGLSEFLATATAYDVADNTTTATLEFTVVYDTEAPTVIATTDTEPNAAGWFNEPVTYTFECDDPSGVAHCPTPVTVSTQGADQTITVVTSDTIGNTTEINYSGINIDNTAPTIAVSAATVVSPADNVTITCGTTDELSGIADTNCATSQLEATSLTPGANTFTFAATDRADNTATTTITINLHVDIDGIAELIALYLGDTPGAHGQLNALTQKLANGDISGFTNHVWAQCCTPAKKKRFTYDQATTLVELAAALP